MNIFLKKINLSYNMPRKMFALRIVSHAPLARSLSQLSCKIGAMCACAPAIRNDKRKNAPTPVSLKGSPRGCFPPATTQHCIAHSSSQHDATLCHSVRAAGGPKTLCTCGASATFPLCDGSEATLNAATGASFAPYVATLDNTKPDKQGNVWPCLCGHSKASPFRFCDGTHKKVKPLVALTQQ
jgi:CDGSH-type Zn-finger protein